MSTVSAGLEFDEATHTYRRDGRRIISVTQALAGFYDWSAVHPDVLALAQDRGTRVHKATELFDHGTLDWSTVDEEVAPYLDAWARFREERKFKPLFIERRMYHPIYAYAGTMDRAGLIDSDEVPAVLDIKAVSKLSPVTGPQTAAYRELADVQLGFKAKRRMAVQLLPNGRYVCEPYRDSLDLPVFLAQVSTFYWRQKHGFVNQSHSA